MYRWEVWEILLKACVLWCLAPGECVWKIASPNSWGDLWYPIGWDVGICFLSWIIDPIDHDFLIPHDLSGFDSFDGCNFQKCIKSNGINSVVGALTLGIPYFLAIRLGEEEYHAHFAARWDNLCNTIKEVTRASKREWTNYQNPLFLWFRMNLVF